MTTILIMMSNYFHDFATALLFCNLVLFYAMTRKLSGPLRLSEAQLDAAFRFTSRVTWIALVWISVGGAIRAWNYRSFEWVEAAGKGQLAALGVKHTILGGVVVAGLWMQFKMTRQFRKSHASTGVQS